MSPPNSSSRFYCPGAHHLTGAMLVYAVFVHKQRRQLGRAEKSERALENGADILAGFQHIDRMFLHQILEPFGERGFAATDWTKEIKNLTLLFEALCGMLEVAHDSLDRVFHAKKTVKGAIGPQRAVEEDAAKARILRGVHELRLTDGRYHAFGGRCIEHLVVACREQPVAQAHRFEALARVIAGEDVEDVKRTHRRLLVRLARPSRFRCRDPLQTCKPLSVIYARKLSHCPVKQPLSLTVLSPNLAKTQANRHARAIRRKRAFPVCVPCQISPASLAANRSSGAGLVFTESA